MANPLTNEEWQEYHDKTIAAMLEDKQPTLDQILDEIERLGYICWELSSVINCNTPYLMKARRDSDGKLIGVLGKTRIAAAAEVLAKIKEG